jgi:hypothetical protein
VLRPTHLLCSLTLYVGLLGCAASGCSDSGDDRLAARSDGSVAGAVAGDSGRFPVVDASGDSSVHTEAGAAGDADTRSDSDGGALADAAQGPAPVLLGMAGSYAMLAKAAISTVPASVVTGNVGLSPAAASYITGFALTKVGTYWTSPQVVGQVFAADGAAPTPSDLTTSVGDMESAYTDAAGRPNPAFLNLGAGAIGGLTLAPGLYKWTSAVTIPSAVTLAGGPSDTWIFQIDGDLTLSSATSMTLAGGAQAKHIVWQVAGVVTLGTTAHAEGVVLSKTAIKLGTNASINGRLLAQTAIDIASSTVTQPAD